MEVEKLDLDMDAGQSEGSDSAPVAVDEVAPGAEEYLAKAKA
jgi:hypothetical protein